MRLDNREKERKMNETKIKLFDEKEKIILIKMKIKEQEDLSEKFVV